MEQLNLRRQEILHGVKFPGRDGKPLKRDALEQTNRVPSAVIMRGNPVLSKRRV